MCVARGTASGKENMSRHFLCTYYKRSRTSQCACLPACTINPNGDYIPAVKVKSTHASNCCKCTPGLRLGIHLLQLLRMFFAALELKECTICCATYAAKIMRTAYIRFDLHVWCVDAQQFCCKLILTDFVK